MSPLLAKRPVVCVRLFLLAVAATILITSLRSQSGSTQPASGSSGSSSLPKFQHVSLRVGGNVSVQPAPGEGERFVALTGAVAP